ncbi:MAG: ABC transporter permease [Acidobacteria bacterium]|nr:ABC transporter permease [Acidobacteriota bacterium]
MPRLRTLIANPVFAAVAIVSLAIGIGANTAIFSVTDALLLRPLPYQDADRLVILWNRSPGLNITEDWFSTAQYFDIRNGHGGFEQLAIAIGGANNLTDGIGEPERVGTIRMSSNLLPMLGVKAYRGRLLDPAEDTPGRAPVALLSYGLWIRRYGGGNNVLQRPVHINGQPYEVAGVLPREFTLPRNVLPTLGGAEQADIVLPLPLSAAAVTDRDHEDYNIIGTLKRGETPERAQAEMNVITARLRQRFPALYPPNGGLSFSIVPLREQVAGSARRGLYLLLGSVGFVLLIACANVANLSLSRTFGRTRELALRSALGADRMRLLLDLLAESLTLSLAGGVVGVLLAVGAVSWIRSTAAVGAPRAEWIGIDFRVLAFTLGVTLAAGLLAGILPAWRASSVDLQAVLRSAGRTASLRSFWGGNRLQRFLVAGEVGLAVVLLSGAGLLVKSLIHLSEVNPGFDARNVLTFNLSMSGRKYAQPKQLLQSYRNLWERLSLLPGAKTVGGVSSLPLTNSFAWGPVTVEGRPLGPGEAFINADWRMVSGRYFEALGIPLLRGRLFDERDLADSQSVVLVDERMARELWQGNDALGKRIRLGGDSMSRWVTVVGVVGGVKQYGLGLDSRIALYLPQSQYPVRAMSVVVKCDCEPAGLVAGAKAAVRAIDPDLPVYDVRTMAHRVADSMARQRFIAMLLAVFAGLAIALAAVGVYGVMAFIVGQGRRDIGIRMALGATPTTIAAMVLKRALIVAGAGLACGLAASAVLSRFIGSALDSVHPADGWTLSAAAAGLLIVALAASYLPARQASRVDPATAIRNE